MRDLWLPTLLKLMLPSSGLLRGVRWIEIGVSGLPISPIFSGQAVQEEGVGYFVCFTSEQHVGSSPTFPFQVLHTPSPY
jgi:hypothetical protein